MKTAIIYSSETGFTKKYALWLEEKLGSDAKAYSLKEAKKVNFDDCDALVYGGTYNDLFNSVEKTSDGGYIVVGSTKSKKINEVSTGVGNGLVVKYDKDGNVEWDKFYGGNAHEEFYDVIVVNDGYVAVGYTMSTDIEGLTNNGSNDGLVVKFDKDGNIVWQTLIGGTGDDYIHAIRVMPNGNLIVVGRFASSIGEHTNNGGLDGFIGMLSSDGELIDSNLYGGTEKAEIRVDNSDGFDGDCCCDSGFKPSVDL